jgi:hypothetical protein
VKLPEQVVRLGIVLITVLAIVLALRFVILPASFFSARPHQAAKVEREMAKPMHYAGAASCLKCHEEQVKAKYNGFHKNIGCENCHGPSAGHVADNKAVKSGKPKDREFCLTCHAYDTARPNGFPQIDPQAHNASKQCVRCHDPHSPAAEEPPKDCSACHRRIDRTKALSTHASLACSECHKADPQHMLQPRTALPTKPANREACGRCHAVGATGPGVSKAAVDMASHGGAYVCWECHYAHLPEGPK